MSHAPDYSYLGSGIVLIRPWGSNEPFAEVGNVSAFSVAPQTNTVQLADHTQPGGATRNRVDRVTDWQLSYTFHDFNAANFARVTRGKATTAAAGSVAEEEVVAHKGAYAPLRFPAATITTVSPAGTGAAFQSPRDYIVDRGMLYMPADSTIPVSANGAANIKVTYTRNAVSEVQGAVTAQQTFEMQFHGQNEARGGKATRLFAHKVSGGVIQSMGLIGDEYGAGEVSGTMLSDNAKRTDSNKSAVFYWQVED